MDPTSEIQNLYKCIGYQKKSSVYQIILGRLEPLKTNGLALRAIFLRCYQSTVELNLQFAFLIGKKVFDQGDHQTGSWERSNWH